MTGALEISPLEIRPKYLQQQPHQLSVLDTVLRRVFHSYSFVSLSLFMLYGIVCPTFKSGTLSGTYGSIEFCSTYNSPRILYLCASESGSGMNSTKSLSVVG